MNERIERFVTGWNDMVKRFDDDHLELKILENYSIAKNLIEALVYQTNIALIPIGSIGFLPELGADSNLCAFGFYDENDSLFIDVSTGEILAADPFMGYPKLISVSLNEETFLNSLILYGELYFQRVVKNVVPTKTDMEKLIRLSGGEKYDGLYQYLIKQLT